MSPKKLLAAPTYVRVGLQCQRQYTYALGSVRTYEDRPLPLNLPPIHHNLGILAQKERVVSLAVLMGVVLRHNHMFDMEVEPCSLLVGVDAYSTPDRKD